MSRTHGQRNTPEYEAWRAMKKRCYVPTASNYRLYGARGVSVCERWRDSFAAFIADVGPRPTAKHSLDRIDNDGNYEPGNVRWASLAEQAENRRVTRRLTVNGETRLLTEWCALAGLKYTTLWERIRRGWTPEDAVSPAEVTS